MTDTMIQFKSSDGVHMVALCIDTDTPQKVFIPKLYNDFVVTDCMHKHLSWTSVVAEVVSRIIGRHGGNVKVILESQIGLMAFDYKYSVAIKEEVYSQTNGLRRFVTIKDLKGAGKFDGYLEAFSKTFSEEVKPARIREIDEEIKELQKERLRYAEGGNKSHQICIHCNNQPGINCINPYIKEIDGVEKWEIICPHCIDEMAADI